MRLSRGALSGAGLGAAVALGATIISLFRLEGTGMSAGEAVLVGLLIGMPIAVTGGFFAGWLWDVVFGRREN